MEIALDGDGAAQVSLDAREVLLLRTALQRALFLDTPPHLQGATMDLAERLLRALGEPGLGDG